MFAAHCSNFILDHRKLVLVYTIVVRMIVFTLLANVCNCIHKSYTHMHAHEEINLKRPTDGEIKTAKRVIFSKNI